MSRYTIYDNDETRADEATLYLDGGGDPDFADIDAFLRAHFAARAVYQDRLDALLAAARAFYAEWSGPMFDQGEVQLAFNDLRDALAAFEEKP